LSVPIAKAFAHARVCHSPLFGRKKGAFSPSPCAARRVLTMETMRSTLFALAASLLVPFLVAACGGRTLVGGDTTDPDEGGGGGTKGGGGAGGTTTGSGGGTCVTIHLSDYNTACAEDADCISVNVGQICPGACLCGGGGAISTSEQARYANALSSIQTDDTCPCPSSGPVTCVGGQCTQCTFGPNDPPGCLGDDLDGGGFDTGLDIDTGFLEDEGVPDTGAPLCVDVDLSTYDTSCTQDSDCVEINAGEICPRTTCLCGGSAVNVSEQARYEAAIAPIVAADSAPSPMPFVCGCPFFGNPVCAKGQCTLCVPSNASCTP
jgi:hypothetical protein